MIIVYPETDASQIGEINIPKMTEDFNLLNFLKV